MDTLYLSEETKNLIRKHLAKVLPRYSSAETKLLIDYVMALLDKEETQTKKKPLIGSLESDLEAFMGTKTKDFVNDFVHFIQDLTENRSNNRYVYKL